MGSVVQFPSPDSDPLGLDLDDDLLPEYSIDTTSTEVELYQPTRLPDRRRPELSIPPIGPTVRAAGKRAGRSMLWHGLQTPKYVWRILKAAATGTAAVTPALWDFYTVRRLRENAALARASGNAARAERAENRQQAVFWVRIIITGVCISVPLAWLIPRIGVTLAVTVLTAPVFLVLVVIGTRARAVPIVDTPRPRERSEINEELLNKALRARGILAKPTARDPEPEGVGIVAFPTMDQYGGVQVKFELPQDCGKSVEDVVKARAGLAGSFSVPWEALDIQRGAHEGMVDMWIGPGKPFANGHQPHPLLYVDQWNVWDGAPFGVDVRSRPVTLPIVFSSFLAGARPRRGKSFSVRAVLAAPVLDPNVRLIIANGKGDGTFAAAKDLCEVYVRGVKRDQVQQLRDALKRAVDDMDERNDRYDGSKITPEICDRYGMPVTVIVVDEVQRYLEDPELGEEIAALLIDIVKVGPSVGYMLVLATQKPDSETIPSALKSQMGCRFCLQVMSWQDSDVILGTSMSKRGYDASAITDRGVGWLRPDDDADGAPDALALLAMAYSMTDEEWAQICARGVELRAEYGAIVDGEVVSEEVDERPIPVPGDLLSHVAALLYDEDEQSATGLLSKLPEPWSQWTLQKLGSELKRLGLEARRTPNKRYFRYADATRLLSNRPSETPSGGRHG